MVTASVIMFLIICKVALISIYWTEIEKFASKVFLKFMLWLGDMLAKPWVDFTLIGILIFIMFYISCG